MWGDSQAGVAEQRGARRTSYPSSLRRVELIDGRFRERPVIEALLYRDYPSSQLEVVESQWAQAREQAAAAGLAAGLAPLEHSHWDWRSKADREEERGRRKRTRLFTKKKGDAANYDILS
jgi:hypothetical protein